MSRFACGLFVPVLFVCVSTSAADEKGVKIVVGRKTTYVTQPLYKDGSIDFFGAINRHFGKGVTAKTNAVVDFYTALPRPEGAKMPAEFFRLIGMKEPTPMRNDYLTFYKYLKSVKITRQHPQWNKIEDSQTAAMSGPWKRTQYPQVAGWLTANEKALKIIVAGTKKPHYFSPLVVPADKAGKRRGLMNALLPGAQGVRSFARALSVRAMRHLGEGRHEDAWNDLMACQRLGRLIGQGPTAIESLVGFATEQIAAQGQLAYLKLARPDARTVARHLQELNSLPSRGSLFEKINLTERLQFLDTVVMTAEGAKSTEEYGSIASVMRMFNQLAGGKVASAAGLPKVAQVDWNETLRIGNGWFDRMAEGLRQPTYTRRALAFAEFDRDVKAIGSKLKDPDYVKKLLADPKQRSKAAGRVIGEVLVALILPAVPQIKTAEDRTIQRFHNLQVAFALAAWRSDKGEYPRRLSDLSPKYLKRIPNDLFIGRPLQYAARKTGYLLYSVGANQKDDRGQTYGENVPADDLRVRMQDRSK